METKLSLAKVAYDTTKLTWLDGISDSMDMSLGKLRKMVKDREAWYAAVHGSQRVGQDWATEQLLGWADFQLWVGPGRLYVSLTLLSLATDYLECSHGESCG